VVKFAVAAILGTLVVGSTAQAEELAYPKNPITLDMFDQASIKPQERPITYPTDTIPTRGKEALMSREDADTKLTNPIPSSPESVAAGKYAFAKNCAACHGLDGKGDTPVAKKLAEKGAVLPELSLVTYRSDGFIYGTIRNGGINMPRYGAQTTPQERWHIVNYVRSLQPK
jgi:mono/diheme cytochrome c family protein